MKTLLQIKITVINVLLLSILPFISLAQSPWSTHGNTGDGESFIGTINHEPLRIKTDSIDRIIISDSIVFKGKAIFDSLIVPTGYLKVDSIRARVIHVGDSSLIIGAVGVGTTNDIASNTAAAINMIRSTGTLSDFTGLNIGTQTSTYMLHIHDDAGSSNNGPYTHYTFSTIGQTTSDGFQTGIDATGNAQLIQKESLPMMFSTNNIERMRILSTGEIGIGITTPATKLHISEPGSTAIFSTASNSSNTGGFQVGLDASGNAQLIQTANKPIMFYTNGFSGVDQMRITGAGLVGIATNPTARLQVWGNGAGDGILIHSNFYMREYSGNWGTKTLDVMYVDQTAGTAKYVLHGAGATNLDFYVHDGKARIGNAVIGGSPAPPAARLESEDGSSTQLRLTRVYNSRYTDFQTTSTGDLYIAPIDIAASPVTRRVGIHTISPVNTLEVRSSVTSLAPVTGASTSPTRSGLRFTSLNSTLAVDGASNAGSGHPVPTVLSVNERGDVIMVNEPNAPLCAYGTTLSSDAGYVLNTRRFYFSGTASTETVGIGYACASAIPAKLNVLSSNNTIAVDATNSFNGGTIAVQGTCANGAVGQIGISGAASGIDKQIGVKGVVTGSNPGGTAGWFESDGGVGIHSYTTNGPGGNTTGGDFQATGTGGQNIGIAASVGNGASNYAVYAIAPANGFNGPGVPITGTNFAGYFNGDVVRIGTDNFLSDNNFKKDRTSVDNVMELISQLNPQTYNFKTDDYPYLSLPTGKQYGLIAQEVEEILPEVVTNIHHPQRNDENGNEISPALDYKALNYIAFIPLLIQGVKDQQQQMSDMQSQINSCCNAPPGGGELRMAGTGNNNSNQSNRAPELSQNVPNPFNHITTIKYFLPENCNQCMIILYDLQGKQLKRFDNLAKGDGAIEIGSGELYPGMFIYALFANGKEMDEKKMILTE